jgi:hypothetical protein
VPERVDVLCFERLVAYAAKASPERAAQLLQEALGLSRGPPLVEFDEAFARVEAGS